MKKNEVLFLLILSAALFAVYWNAFGYELVWDSKNLFDNNILLEKNKPLSAAFNTGYFSEQLGAGRIDLYYRPLLTMSFMLENKIWGIQAAKLRIINLTIYVLALFFLFFFFKRQRREGHFAETVIILFAFNPLNLENIVWVVGRGDLLLLLWGSLTMLFLELSLSKRRFPYLACSSFFYLMGILSKESFVFFLPLLFLYELIKKKRISLPYHLANLILTLLFFAVKSQVLRIKSLEFSLPPELLTGAKLCVLSLGYYIRTIFSPIRHEMFIPLEQIHGLPYFLLGIGAILAFMILLVRCRKNPDIVIPLVLIFIFVSGHLLLLFTNLFPYKVYARYMVIPALGVIWILATLLQGLKGKLKYAAVFILILIFIPSTILNARVFKDETQFFLKAHRSFPDDGYLLFQTAKAFFSKDDYLTAELYLNKTLSAPQRKETAILINMLYSDIDFKKAGYDNVIQWLKKIEALEDSHEYQLAPLIHYQIRWKKILVSMNKGDWESAERLLSENITHFQDKRESYLELHRLYASHGLWEKAELVEKRIKEKFDGTQDVDTARLQSEFRSLSQSEKITFFIQNRNFKAAIDIIRSLSAHDLEHKILLAKLNYWRGEEEEGEKIIKDILLEHPESIEVCNRIGTFYLQDLIRAQQALVYLEKSLEMNPSQQKVRSLVLLLKEEYIQELKDTKHPHGILN